jgi:hypothetical protein
LGYRGTKRNRRRNAQFHLWTAVQTAVLPLLSLHTRGKPSAGREQVFLRTAVQTAVLRPVATPRGARCRACERTPAASTLVPSISKRGRKKKGQQFKLLSYAKTQAQKNPTLSGGVSGLLILPFLL